MGYTLCRVTFLSLGVVISPKRLRSQYWCVSFSKKKVSLILLQCLKIIAVTRKKNPEMMFEPAREFLSVHLFKSILNKFSYRKLIKHNSCAIDFVMRPGSAINLDAFILSLVSFYPV